MSLKSYPKVLTEDQTLDRALAGESIARYGNGELDLCVGKPCRFQRHSLKLQTELRLILGRPSSALICIPNVRTTVRWPNWRRYTADKFVELYKLPLYGSAFISRPDSSPWINRPDYWDKMAQLWRGRDVTFVWEDKESPDLSFTPDMLSEAASLREVRGSAQDAYCEIDRIEEEIGTPPGTVLLCLGPAATCLAVRLANKGVHAVDIGHAGMFMRELCKA